MPLSKNQIYQGDCVSQLANLKKGSVDLVFADPPFNIGYEYDVYDDVQSSDDYLGWCRQWIDGVYRALKPDGTFWLAIGDEYAAELKVESQKAGFHCRSWVIWYYTFGVNCANGFSRSHTHLFHFVKDPKNFTFVRPNPNVRVKSARQLVYADLRANPSGRLPDNTWITRPQDAPDSFRANHDTWFFSRVAGTFKEREGFHGCQMPEQLLARIIRTSSHPYELVLDPFGGSGTTLCVAKKLHRDWMGFELSKKYVKHIRKRLDQTHAGDPIDGPEDPIESAPATSKGKRRKHGDFDEHTIQAVVQAYQSVGDGLSVDHVLCDKDLNKRFIKSCLKQGIGGNAIVWNRLMLKLRKARKLPSATQRTKPVPAEQLSQYGYASEVAWRLIADEFGSENSPFTLDDILCCPDSAEYFDQIAAEYGPRHIEVTSLQYRLAAIAIRKQAKQARKLAKKLYGDCSREDFTSFSPEDLEPTFFENDFDGAGVYVITSGEVGIFAGETKQMREHLNRLIHHPAWKKFAPDEILVHTGNQTQAETLAMKAAIIAADPPLLNSPTWLGKQLGSKA